jgi:hypothetical protein
MPDLQLSPVEPFVEQIDPARDLANADAYRFGYRVERTKDVLYAIEIPAEVVARV